MDFISGIGWKLLKTSIGKEWKTYREKPEEIELMDLVSSVDERSSIQDSVMISVDGVAQNIENGL